MNKGAKNYLQYFEGENPKDLVELILLFKEKRIDSRNEIPYYVMDILSWDKNKCISPIFNPDFCTKFRAHPVYKLIKDAPFLDKDTFITIKQWGTNGVAILAHKNVIVEDEIKILNLNDKDITLYSTSWVARARSDSFNMKRSSRTKIFKKFIENKLKLEEVMLPSECIINFDCIQSRISYECAQAFPHSIILLPEKDSMVNRDSTSFTDIKTDYHKVFVIRMDDK